MVADDPPPPPRRNLVLAEAVGIGIGVRDSMIEGGGAAAKICEGETSRQEKAAHAHRDS